MDEENNKKKDEKNPRQSDDLSDISKENKEQERTRINKKLFLQYFPQYRGVIRHTCKKIDINEDTFYEWRKNDPEFAEKIKNATVNIRDKIRDVLLKKILIEEDGPSVRYWLDRKDPEFMPKAKTEVITGDRTLEDLLDEDEEMLNNEVDESGDGKNNTTNEKEKEEGSAPASSEFIQDSKQEGGDSEVQSKQSTGVLLEKKDQEKSNSESSTKGNLENHRRGPAPRLHSERY